MTTTISIMLFGILAVVVFLWVIPKWQVSRVENLKDRIELETEARKTLAQIIGGGLLIAGLFFSAKTLQLSQENLRISQEGQITDRFSRAVEHLGNKNLETRLGGIYALERIARDSPKDHWNIMEILTAYVRENARWNSKNKDKKPATNVWGHPLQIGRPGVKLSEDIQAILTVLGRRTQTYQKGEKFVLDLSGTDLRSVILFDAHLEGALLAEAQLEGAVLVNAHLENALLPGANLTEVNFSGANLQGTYGTCPDLTDTPKGDYSEPGGVLWRHASIRPSAKHSKKKP